jgi:hypothetical protein
VACFGVLNNPAKLSSRLDSLAGLFNTERTPVKCSVSDEPGCWPGDANAGEDMFCA